MTVLFDCRQRILCGSFSMYSQRGFIARFMAVFCVSDIDEEFRYIIFLVVVFI